MKSILRATIKILDKSLDFIIAGFCIILMAITIIVCLQVDYDNKMENRNLSYYFDVNQNKSNHQETKKDSQKPEDSFPSLFGEEIGSDKSMEKMIYTIWFYKNTIGSNR